MRHNDNTDRRVRSSALWGSGSPKGDSRLSALWGNGGRGMLLALAAIASLAFPFAAAARRGAKQPAQDYVARWLQTQQLLAATPAAPEAPTPVATAPTTYITPG